MKTPYESLLERAGVTNVSIYYRDHANPVKCKPDLSSKPRGLLFKGIYVTRLLKGSGYLGLLVI